MTAVAFHTGLDDPMGYACRLLRKAVRQGARVVVSADAPTLDVLDKALWTFDAQDFVPHLRWQADREMPAHLGRTPLWLVLAGEEGAAAALEAGVVVRIGALEPIGPGTPAERVIELVGAEDDERRSARRRWRAYEALGWQVQHHPAGQSD